MLFLSESNYTCHIYKIYIQKDTKDIHIENIE